MSTTETAPPSAEQTHEAAPATFRGIPLTRLITVELRKLADTRAGLWLLILIVLASAATTAILYFSADNPSFTDYFTLAQIPAGVLLPVLGILSMTGEWSQRTALATFTLEPRRGRVIGAKLLAGVVIGVLAAASGFVWAALGTAISGGVWGIEINLLWQCALLQVAYVLMGLAFGALLQNTPLAIVTFFAVPMVWTILGSVVRALEKPAQWLDLNLTTAPLTLTEGLSGGEWARFGVSAAVWILVPLVAGTVRMLRREVS